MGLICLISYQLLILSSLQVSPACLASLAHDHFQGQLTASAFAQVPTWVLYSPAEWGNNYLLVNVQHSDSHCPAGVGSFRRQCPSHQQKLLPQAHFAFVAAQSKELGQPLAPVTFHFGLHVCKPLVIVSGSPSTCIISFYPPRTMLDVPVRQKHVIQTQGASWRDGRIQHATSKQAQNRNMPNKQYIISNWCFQNLQVCIFTYPVAFRL